MQDKRVSRVTLAAMIVLLTMAFAGPSMGAAPKKEAPKKEEQKKVEQKTTNDKVAVVDGVVISKADYDREVDSVMKRFAASGQQMKEEDMDKLRKNVLDGVIDGELLYQASKKEGFKVDSAAVDQQIESIKKNFPSEEQFKSELAKAQRTESQMRADVERNLMIQQLIKEKIAKDMTIADEDTKKFYDNNTDSFKQPEQIKASHILIPVDEKDDDAKKTEARKKIEAIEKKIKDGGDFAALAKENSSCPSAANGGDLGLFGRGQMVKPFDDAAFALKVGEVSGIVETNFGFHLIKLTEKKEAGTVEYEQVKDRISQYLQKEKVQKAILEYLEKVKKTAKVERFNG